MRRNGAIARTKLGWTITDRPLDRSFADAGHLAAVERCPVSIAPRSDERRDPDRSIRPGSEARMGLARRLWKRHVSGRPDGHQAYVSFPGDADAAEMPGAAAIHDRIESLERLFDGRLDVYARRSGLAVTTDVVPAERFDASAFASVVDALESLYAETHVLARLEKRRWLDDRLVRYHVVVPVKPLYSPTRPDTGAKPDAPVQVQ